MPENNAERNRAIVAEVYDAAARMDLSVLARYLAHDCRLIEPAGHPIGRTEWHGREAFMAGVGEVFALVNLKALKVKEIVADGPFRVIGLLEIVIADGHEHEHTMPFAEVFRIDDGLITEIRAFYFDLVALNDIIGVAAR